MLGSIDFKLGSDTMLRSIDFKTSGRYNVGG